MKDDLPLDRNAPVPPPSAELLAQVGAMKKVRTRVPMLAFAIVCLLAAAWASHWLFMYPLRRDLPGLPLWWLLPMGALWIAAYFGGLAMAMLPPKAQVLPDPNRAFSAAVVATFVLVIAQFALNVTGPATIMASRSDHFYFIPHCVEFELKVAVVPIVLCLIALRAVVPAASWRVGAASGAAGGALGGFMLHLLCPYGGAIHTGFAHGGGVVVCAVAGAVVTGAVFAVLRR